ncbi:MAG: alpha/beta fold hydrolase [Hyphomicrobiales bacterium]
MAFAPLPDGDELYYETHGSGPPVLIVSGLGGRPGFWQPLLGELTKDFTIILHDHRGTGSSSKPHFTYSVEQMAADVAALLDHLNIEKAGLVGHSTGGAIGQVMAIDHPHRLSALMIASSWPGKDAYFEEFFRARKKLIETSGPAEYVRTLFIAGYPPKVVSDNPHLVADPSEEDVALAFPDVDCFIRRIDAIRAFDRRTELENIDMPVLVTCARDDMITPIHFSQELAKRIPGAVVDFIETGAHFYPVLQQGDFCRQVRSLFTS